MKRPELLVPASSLEVLKVAVIYGADAVYIGGEAFGLRAKAKNFSKEDMREGIAFAHAHGVKVYVTVNILAHNRDLEGVREYLQELKEIGPDALIIADPGVFMLAKEICPEIERHISTQANNTNYLTYQFWYQQGAKRVVSARELSMEELRELRAEAHRQFDKLYKHGYMSKHDAYQWLGGILSVPAKQAHIAQLSLLSCNLVIREAKKQVNWYHMRKMAALQQTQEGDVKAS